MQFLNTLLLGGIAAGTIPVILHLLKRRRKNIVAWGALQFLTGSASRQRRSVKIEQLLLLLLRTFIPIFLALCMARPVLPWVPQFKTSVPLSLVILIDDSASMGLRDNDRSPASRAFSAANRFINELPKGSEVSILTITNPEMPIAELTTDATGAASALAKHIPTPSCARITAALEEAEGQLKKAHHLQKHLVIFTDFQKQNWSGENRVAQLQSFEKLHSQHPSAFVSFFDAGEPFEGNLAVNSLQFSSLPLGTGQPVRFVATLQNYGSTLRQNLYVHWKVDAKVLSTQVISVGPNQSTQVFFDHAFAENGAHSIEVQTDPDSQPSDDSIFACIEVSPPIEVLLVNGQASPQPMSGETDFLEIALRPNPTATGVKAGMLRPRVIEPLALNNKALSSSGVVVLAGIKNLTKKQVEEIEAYVRKGGGLLFFPNAQTDVQWYNKELYKEGLGLLPGRIEGLRNSKTSEQGKTASVSAPLNAHPVLEPFLEGRETFSELKLETWYSLRTETLIQEGPASPPLTIMSLDNGDPLFIEKRFGEGFVIQSAFPCSAAWSNLSARPAFVPLMQRLILRTASAATSENRFVGESLLVALPLKYANLTTSVRVPDGAVRSVLAVAREDKAFVDLTGSSVPGFYEVLPPGGEVRRIALNVSRDESDPARLDKQAIDSLATEAKGRLVRTPDDIYLQSNTLNGGREGWHLLLLATLVLVFGEILFLRHLKSRKVLAA